MAFVLPELPYSKDALAPYMSAETLTFHHDKHHKAYVDNLNKLVEGTPLANASLEEVILESSKNKEAPGIFNNSAQVWNHTFFWNCLKKDGGSPKGAVAQKIDSDLGGYEKFVEQFKTAATTQFGSGWAWLVLEGDKLKVVKTGNADLPLAHGQKALLTLDVWEHAYYLDFQNRRPDFIAGFLEHLVNWDYVEENLQKA